MIPREPSQVSCWEATDVDTTATQGQPTLIPVYADTACSSHSGPLALLALWGGLLHMDQERERMPGLARSTRQPHSVQHCALGFGARRKAAPKPSGAHSEQQDSLSPTERDQGPLVFAGSAQRVCIRSRRYAQCHHLFGRPWR